MAQKCKERSLSLWWPWNSSQAKGSLWAGRSQVLPQTLLQIVFKGRAEISVCKLLNTLKALAINVCACVCTKRKMKSSIFQEPDIFQGFILAAILADLFPYNPIPSLRSPASNSRGMCDAPSSALRPTGILPERTAGGLSAQAHFRIMRGLI